MIRKSIFFEISFELLLCLVAKAQISLETKILLDTIGGYKINDKGMIDVKGKYNLCKKKSHLDISPFLPYHLPYLLTISISIAVTNDFSTNLMKALGLIGTVHSFNIRAKSLANGSLMTVVLMSRYSPKMPVGPVILELVAFYQHIFRVTCHNFKLRPTITQAYFILNWRNEQ